MSDVRAVSALPLALGKRVPSFWRMLGRAVITPCGIVVLICKYHIPFLNNIFIQFTVQFSVYFRLYTDAKSTYHWENNILIIIGNRFLFLEKGLRNCFSRFSMSPWLLTSSIKYKNDFCTQDVLVILLQVYHGRLRKALTPRVQWVLSFLKRKSRTLKTHRCGSKWTDKWNKTVTQKTWYSPYLIS